MLQSTHINIDYAFYDVLERKGMFIPIPAQDLWSGIDRICRTLSAVPIARISWTDVTVSGSWEITGRYLQPLAMFPVNSSFRIDHLKLDSTESCPHPRVCFLPNQGYRTSLYWGTTACLSTAFCSKERIMLGIMPSSYPKLNMMGNRDIAPKLYHTSAMVILIQKFPSVSSGYLNAMIWLIQEQY